MTQLNKKTQITFHCSNQLFIAFDEQKNRCKFPNEKKSSIQRHMLCVSKSQHFITLSKI